jgi:hypothetical protein
LFKKRNIELRIGFDCLALSVLIGNQAFQPDYIHRFSTSGSGHVAQLASPGWVSPCRERRQQRRPLLRATANRLQYVVIVLEENLAIVRSIAGIRHGAAYAKLLSGSMFLHEPHLSPQGSFRGSVLDDLASARSININWLGYHSNSVV